MNKYLKDNVKMEPLAWKWYAWSHLISPLTAACNISERYLKILRSYVQFPQIHNQAVKNPKLMGGPFIDLEGKYIDEIKDLIKYTEENCKELIQLYTSVKSFEKLLQREAIGNSLENFYTKLPDNLRGLVELVYDTSNHPSILFIEKFIYNKYYTDTHQAISLSLIDSDKRPFIMSTPRINTEAEVYIRIPFSHIILDELFKSKHFPTDVFDLMERLNIAKTQEKNFLSLFTEVPPMLAADRNYNGNDIRIRFLGHACILIQTSSISILIDPVLSYPVKGEPRFTYNDLPDVIDYVLLTHNHQDHVLLETLLQIRYKVKKIVIPKNRKGALEDPSLKLILKQIGFKDVVDLEELDSIEIEGGEIIGLPFFGEHCDLNIHTKLAHCIILKNKKFLMAADSNNLDPYLYDHIFNYIGDIDVLFLGMECDGAPLSWIYTPYMLEPLKKSYDEERRLSGSNFEKAWSIAEKSKCKQAYVYAMGMEPWLTHIMAVQYTSESIPIIESDKFVIACKAKGIQSERLFMKKEWFIF